MSLEKVTQQLKTAFEKQDYRTSIKLLPLIKVELAKHNLLVPILNNKVNEGDLIISRSILEIGALSAINVSDLPLFEKYIYELKPFYKLNTEIFVKNKSPNENKLVALYLLLLLTKGDISQFHIELLSLSAPSASSSSSNDASQIENDDYLNYPIKIERWLMEGSYDKVWNLINDASSSQSQQSQQNFKEFYLFNKNLNNTLRNEIAKCLNVSYEKLPVANAKNLLFFENEGKLINFVKTNTKWEIENGVIIFNNSEEDSIEHDNEEDFNEVLDEAQLDAPKEKLGINELLIKNTLGYASELETIV